MDAHNTEGQIAWEMAAKSALKDMQMYTCWVLVLCKGLMFIRNGENMYRTKLIYGIVFYAKFLHVHGFARAGFST